MNSTFDDGPGGSTDSLRTQLLRSAQDFSQLYAFIENLRLVTGSDAALFRYLDLKDLSYPVTVTSGDQDIFSETFFAEYDGGMVMSDPQIKFGLDHKISKYSVYLCHEQYSEEERKQFPYFQEFLPKHNIKWFAGYLAQFDNAYGAGFGIARAPGKPHYSDREKAILSTLTPILEDWARVFLFCQHGKIVQSAISKAHEIKASFAACIDAQGRMLWKDDNCENIFKDIKGLTLKEKDLIAKTSTEGARFLEAVKAAAAKPRIGFPPPQSAQEEMTVALEDDKEVAVRFLPIFAEAEHLEAAALKACLVIGAPVSTNLRVVTSDANQNDLEEKLSKKELEVARLISKGYKAPKIAQHLNVEPSTIHTHLKRAYRKLGINSQQELTALYIQSGLPLHKDEDDDEDKSDKDKK